MEEQRIRAEARRAAFELMHMVEDDSGAAVHGLDNAADVDVEIAILAKLADLFAILPGIDDGEDAFLVRGVGRADVEVSGAVWQLDDVADVRGDTDVFVKKMAGLVGGDAGLAAACEGEA